MSDPIPGTRPPADPDAATAAADPRAAKTADAAVSAETMPAAARDLSPAARRALAEAEERRRAAAAPALPPEIDGRGGLEPVRYGDWEIKGLAVDF